MKTFPTLAIILLLLLFSAATQPKMAASAPAVDAQPAVASPGPRAGHLLVYDEQQHRVTLLDGYPLPNQPQFTEVWTWDGTQWQLVPGSGPAARTLSGAAYDSRRQRIVSFGGIRGNSDSLGDTWEWDGNSWQQMADTSVGSRDHHAMAYDEARGKTVLYGGLRTGALDTNTWQWDGTMWTQLATPGPGGRGHFAMVYDSTHEQVVLFGGLGEGERYSNDTWVWDGQSWRMVSETGPPPRARHRMAFDRQAGAVLLYGGDRGTSVTPSGERRFEVLEDMWRWDGQNWTEIRLNGPTPGKRFMHAMAYDAARGKIILYGGSDGERDLADTWEWDGQSWQQVAPPVIQYRGNAARTGYYEVEGLRQMSAIRWQARVGGVYYAAPVFADGVIYLGSQDRRLYAFDSRTGQRLWSFKTKGPIFSSVAVADGVLYLGSKKQLNALDSRTGQKLWSFKVKGGTVYTPPLVVNGMIFFATENGTCYGLDASTE